MSVSRASLDLRVLGSNGFMGKKERKERSAGQRFSTERKPTNGNRIDPDGPKRIIRNAVFVYVTVAVQSLVSPTPGTTAEAEYGNAYRPHDPRRSRACFLFYYFRSRIMYITLYTRRPDVNRARVSPAYRCTGFNKHNSETATSFFRLARRVEHNIRPAIYNCPGDSLFNARGVGPSLRSFPLTVHNIIGVAGRSSPERFPVTVALTLPSPGPFRLLRPGGPFPAFRASVTRPVGPTRQRRVRRGANMAATERGRVAHGHRRKRRVTRWHPFARYVCPAPHGNNGDRRSARAFRENGLFRSPVPPTVSVDTEETVCKTVRVGTTDGVISSVPR